MCIRDRFICWIYVKNCIFVHMTDKNFLVINLRKPMTPLAPKVEVLEPPLLT